MKFIWTIVWAFLLSLMTAYVVSNMSSASFSAAQVIIMTILFSGAVFVLGEGILEKEA
ncbi:DUF2929 family protein [Halobacillus sp. Marseille-Q1614]|uniref:DUF2929 family protein n=1 Tax=Halobacillus sp. Marseille-Q1614 TaxID=2709134 RepID=UPI00156F3160|nr:DUF2929 family protein [Halobacillus sp. Marseille-Q1614]